MITTKLLSMGLIIFVLVDNKNRMNSYHIKDKQQYEKDY